MKVIKSSVSITPQEEGVIGLMKHLEKIGRVAYMSEDKITEDSYKKFVDMIYNRGHWAVFDSGTVYLSYPLCDDYSDYPDIIRYLLNNQFTKYNKLGKLYITTNYRVLLQYRSKTFIDSFIEKYWCEPTKYHYRRVTSRWVCSRDIAQELTRHRCMSFLMESQRYINYSKEKFGSGITFILPQFVYRVRNSIGNTIDPLTGNPRDYLLRMDGEDLWKELCCFDRTISSRDKIWKSIEEEYLYETTTDEGEHLKAEEARGCLCNDTKTELFMTGWLSDYILEPDINSKEKKGFFSLRCAPDAKEDIRVLATSLKNQFEVNDYYNLL